MTSNKIVGHGLAGLTGKLAILFLSALLAACGGGGGSGGSDDGGSSSSSSGGDSSGGDSSGGDSSSGGGEAAPDQPTLTMDPQAIKTFHFNWQPVEGASEYRLLENPDGVSGYAQIASMDSAATNYALTVFLPGRVNASYMLQACNSTGCTDSESVAVSGSLGEAIGYLKASNSGTFDGLGSYTNLALSADGTTLAVGATGEDSSAMGIDGDQSDNSAESSGAVYVFVKEGDAWQQQAYLKASNAEANDYFGGTLTLSADGSTLVVGATGEASSATGINGDQTDNSASKSGAAYVFVRTNDTWQQQAYIKASNTDADDSFGSSLAISADASTLAVGAWREASIATGVNGDQSDNSAGYSGAIYIFSYNNESWEQQAYLKAAIAEAGMSFGDSPALSADGNTLAVGASGDSSGAQISGAVYVFTRSEGAWQQQQYLKASNPGFNDYFGLSIALSADATTMAVGAPIEKSSATGIDGDQLDNSAYGSGAVYVFTLNNNTWQQEAYIKASNTGEDDTFGEALDLSADGATLAVAAPSESSAATGLNGDQSDNSGGDNGAVYIFSRANGEWRQQAYLKASNTGTDDYFGGGLALSADGSTLAVGAVGEDSAATGIGGDQANNSAEDSGAVYLY